MSKKEKLIQKLRNNPTNVKFEVIQSLLMYYGFEERIPRGGSSHYTYTCGRCIITAPRHKPVKKIYVKRVLEILEQSGLIEKE